MSAAAMPEARPERQSRGARRSLPPTLAATLTAALALLVQACSPGPSGEPSPGTSPGGSAPPTSGAVASAPVCVATTAPTLEPWRDRVFYEVFVRSFSDADGDGIGDLPGLTAKLDALNDGDPATTSDLGITGIWLMPVAESVSYHGYDVVDFTAVERDYGDLSTMRQLVQAAHERGILVIVDFVINHTSRDHPWFEDALAGGEHRDWYVWSETDPGWPAVAGPNPWHETPAGDFYYGAFWEGMPDLNLRNPEVTAELTRVAEVWLEDVGIDGFRIDAAKHLVETGADAQINTPETKAWLADFRAAIHQTHPDALVLGEVYDARGISSSYTREGALDLSFDFGVGPALANGVYGDATTVLASVEEVAERYGPGAAATFLSNHDQTRFATQLKGDLEAAKRAAAVLLTGPGVPFIYYGEELGMTGTKPDELLRTPYPWTGEAPGHGFTGGTPWEPFADGAPTSNLASESTDPASVWSTYRDFVQLRVANPALRAGELIRVKASSRSVAAWLRVFGDQRVLVLHNLGGEAAANVSLDLESGPLCGAPIPALVHSTTSVGAAAAAPAITAEGGLDGYVPFPELPARSTVILDLTPPE
jgi:alpha-amylase